MDNNENQEQTQKFPGTEIVERSAVEAIERAQIDIQIATAQKYKKHAPEMMSRVKANMLTLATLDEETAASCFYTLPRGGKSIQGESVRLTEIALVCYGNARVATRIIDIITAGDDPHVVIQAVAHDLENNTAYSCETRRRITKKKFKDKVDEDDIQLATNACSAIAGRNAVLKMIPKAFVRPIMLAAKKVAVGDVKSLVAKRATVIERLKAMGATEDRILAVVGCLKIEDIGVDALSELIGLGTALKDGETSLEDAFPPIVVNKPGVEGVKERLKKDKEQPVSSPVADPELAELDRFAPANPPKTSQDDPGTTNVRPEERYVCRECGWSGAKLGGLNKDICPHCLSPKQIIDRLAKKS